MAEKEGWDKEFSDRRQELVIIGIKHNEDEIRAALDECIVTDEEFELGLDGWKQLPDPFPNWILED